MSIAKSMRFFRLLFLAVGGVMLLAGLGIALAFNGSFQTWAARRALAARPELGLSFDRVEAGWGRIRVQGLRMERDGMFLAVPALEVDLPLWQAAVNRSAVVSRLVAQGWVLNVAKSGSAPASATKLSALAPGPSASGAASVPGRNMAATADTGGEKGQRGFAGLFTGIELPVALSLDGVNLQGEVILPQNQGRTKLLITGGGFAAGKEGALEITAESVLTDPRVSALEAKATLRSAMDSPRSVRRVVLNFDATARGKQFPDGVSLGGTVSAGRVAPGESYGLTLATHGREIVSLQADYVRQNSALRGRWKVNMRDAEVAPFLLGVTLPSFGLAGEGTVEADGELAAIRVEGKLTADGERLEVIRRELAVLGKVHLNADFDLADRRGALEVRRLNAAVAALEPLASVRALQPFEINSSTGEVRAADPAKDLVGVVLHGIPVAWANPFLGAVAVSGGTVRGELVGLPRGGGVAMRSVGPLVIGPLSVATDEGPLLQQTQLTFATTMDYNPQGWQAEVEGLSIKSDGGVVLNLDAKAGRLAGAGQPLRAAGKLSARLPALLAQPVAQRRLALASGDAVVEFAASLGALHEFHAKVELKGLEAIAEGKPVALPGLLTDLRADVAADGRIGFSAPITIQAGKRQSDLAVSGTLAPAKGGLGTLDATLTSNQLVVDDAKAFLGALSLSKPEIGNSTGGAAASRTAAPPWAGIAGSLNLRLREVIYSDAVKVSNVVGRIQLDSGKVKLEGVQVGLGEGGRANLEGTVTFDAARDQPYALDADLALKEFDPGPLLRATDGGQHAPVEGKFDLVSRVSSRAATLEELAIGAGGDFQLTSKGGVFRGLPAAFANPVAGTGKVAGLIAAAGSAIGGLTGKKEPSVVSSKAQAVAEFASSLSAITFDQLSVAVSRDPGRNAILRDFTLIAPEVRLTGAGTILHRPGASILEDSLAMEFRLRARGRQGELLKYLGALDSVADELGYVACTLPLRVGGSLGKPDAGDLNTRLAALALEKAGVTEKASELFNKLIGGAK